MPISQPMNRVSFSRAVYDDHDRLLRMTLSQDAKYRLYTPLKSIPKKVIEATLLQEDQYFYWHLGINPLSLGRAIYHTYFTEGRRLGASTISMQLARMRYNINSKTVLGKLKQIMIALQLEAQYSKNEILEAYLNLAPYGNNVEGIGAAALLYFDKPIEQLNLPEILTLVTVPQNPTKRMPNKNVLQLARIKFFSRWVEAHPEDKKLAALMSLPLSIRSVKAAPFYAPHFVNQVLEKNSFGNDQIKTTLDLSLQKTLQATVTHYLERKQKYSINNAAVILIDTRDMGVKALVGSANFLNKKISGQINGTDIKRSPGSTLKPFIYALALDQGLIHPATILKDVPRSFGSYNPENFDYDFVGPIKAKDALILSRNIPAVYLADQLHQPSLYQFLQSAHVTFAKSESYYGLALVLGGAEITMQELASLYATLANQGTWQPLQMIKSNEKLPQQALLSKEASFLVLDMLKQTERANTHYGVTKSDALVPAWKTGTSSGYRDAWTVGVIGPYVLAVWVGNFNNQSNPAFIGKETAAPLFFEITSNIKPQLNLKTSANNPTLNLTKVKVCKASGMLPTKYCLDQEETWFIPGKSPIKRDTIYREIALNKKTGLRACHFDQEVEFKVYEFWSSDLLKIFKKAGIPRKIPPVYDAECDLTVKKTEGLAPQILSPQTAVNYLQRIEATSDTNIPFTAVADADVTNLYWFVNETFVGKTARDLPYIWLAKPGKFAVRVVDDFGRSDVKDIRVSAT